MTDDEFRPADKHGIPIYPGDVLKTFHYKSTSGWYMYLYHVVVEKDGHMEGWPAPELANGCDGGRFWITKNLVDSEIVQGSGPEKGQDFTERKELEIVGTDSPICPYCGKKDYNAGTVAMNRTRVTSWECDSCRKVYIVSVSVSTTFTTKCREEA